MNFNDFYSIKSAHTSASIIVGAFVLPLGKSGMTDASTTRSDSIPLTLNSASTAPSSDWPRQHPPTGW